MSTDASAYASPDGIPDVKTADEMAMECEAVIEWIDDKLENGRIRDPEHARARAGYLRIKLQAIGEWRKLKETRDLEELRDEVEALKEARDVS